MSNDTNLEALNDDSEALNDLPIVIIGWFRSYPSPTVFSLHCLKIPTVVQLELSLFLHNVKS